MKTDFTDIAQFEYEKKLTKPLDDEAIKKYDEEGRLHCDNGPAVVYNEYMREYYRHGVLHRDIGPAVEWHDPNMVLHKTEFWVNGQLHRSEDIGPAQIFDTNFNIAKNNTRTQKYYWFGKLHRTNGPAVISTNEPAEFWVDGERVNKEQFKKTVLNYKIRVLLNDRD